MTSVWTRRSPKRTGYTVLTWLEAEGCARSVGLSASHDHDPLRQPGRSRADAAGDCVDRAAGRGADCSTAKRVLGQTGRRVKRPAAHCPDFSGQLLERGFWVYVWIVTPPGGREAVQYVGMTGDTGSYSAKSPFNRISQHLGHNPRNNTLRKYLDDEKPKPKPEDCEFHLVAYGPIRERTSDRCEVPQEARQSRGDREETRDGLVSGRLPRDEPSQLWPAGGHPTTSTPRSTPRSGDGSRDYRPIRAGSRAGRCAARRLAHRDDGGGHDAGNGGDGWGVSRLIGACNTSCKGQRLGRTTTRPS